MRRTKYGKRSADIRIFLISLQDLCRPHIDQFEISIIINDHVFRLQIPVDYVMRVEVLQHEDGLRGVEDPLR